MKKVLLTLAAMTAIVANAQNKQLVSIENYNVAEDGTETLSSVTESDFYDKNNLNTLQLTSYSKTLFTYNAVGLKAASVSYSWSDATCWATSDANTKAYEYDADGNLVKETSASGSYVEYDGYEHGYYSNMKTPYYETNFKLYFNDANQLVKRDQVMADGVTVNQREVFTYAADGKLSTLHKAYVNGETETYPSDATYTYNADGTIASILTVAESRYGKSTTKTVYRYVAMSADYVPANVKAVAGASNTVSMSWDAVKDASAYVVLYDQKMDTVKTTSFTTASLLDGEHQFYVQAIVDGQGRNISDLVSVAVKDLGKLPASNFNVIGVEVGEDSNGSVVYNTKVQWTLPETESVITGYKFYFGENSWNCVELSTEDVVAENGVITVTAPLSIYNIGDYDTDAYEYVPGVRALSVAVVYATGESEKSNESKWNYADNTSSVSSVGLAAEAAATYYNVSGVKLSSAEKGVNIVRKADGSVVKVMK